jgi:CrcB protein
MKQVLLVFLGGGAGSALRWYFSIMVNHSDLKWIPTLSVNVIGCFLLGLCYGLLDREIVSSPGYLLIATGFCGGLTTFSTFSLEAVNLLRNNQYLEAIGYISVSLFLGIAMVFLGFTLIKNYVS